MLYVNSTELYSFLKEQTQLTKTLSDKELVLSIFAAQHLQGHHDFHSGTGTAATGVGLAMSFFTANPAFTALTIVTGCFGALTAFYNMHKSRKLNKFIDAFSEELIKRFPNIIEAYVEISSMIQKVEREEIIEFFNKAKKNN